MALEIPKIDDRNYELIFRDALARIPVHNPEWTNFNDSDPGVTLIQLFSFMTESILYRANLIPERNRIKFLNLLGIPIQAEQSATGIVTFSDNVKRARVEILPRDIEVLAGQVPFRTLNGLDVLPIESSVFYKRPVSEERQSELEQQYLLLFESFNESDFLLTFYDTTPLEAPQTGEEFDVVDLVNNTLDGSLWVAILARSPEEVDLTRGAIANKVLTFGVLPALDDASKTLAPGRQFPIENSPPLLYQIPIGGSLPLNPEERVPQYRTLTPESPADVLSGPGVVNLQLPTSDDLRLWDNLEPIEQGVGDFPPTIEDTEIENRIITWVRIRLAEIQPRANIAHKLRARFSWIGVNAARIVQKARVPFELAGRGTGEPDQIVTLVNTPVIKESVQVFVNGKLWKQIDDLLAAPPEVKVQGLTGTVQPTTQTEQQDTVQSTENEQQDTDSESDSSLEIDEESYVYVIDRQSGEIRFGTGLNGARPRFGAEIRVSYEYGGGRQGNVGIGAITKGPTLTSGIKVINEIQTFGGDDPEPVQEALRQIPAFIRHNDRLMSYEDFKLITERTPGVDIGRVEILPLFHPSLPRDIPAQGVVTVMVIPKFDLVHRETPEPDKLFIETICRHLESRRLVTTEVHVVGPQYVSLWVSIGIEVIPGADFPVVREEVKNAVQKFLSPFQGGFAQNGWPLGRDVEEKELFAIAARVNGIEQINSILLIDSDSLSSVDRVRLDDLQLPRLVDVSVQDGQPLSIEELRGDSSAAAPVGGFPPGVELPQEVRDRIPGQQPGQQPQEIRVVPVPAPPPEC